MRKMPLELIAEIEADPYYKICARKGSDCSGRITWEHVFIYAGKQINEKWSIIPLCWYHHLGAGMIKWLNEYIAIERADEDELDKYPRKDWTFMRSSLLSRFTSSGYRVRLR